MVSRLVGLSTLGSSVDGEEAAGLVGWLASAWTSGLGSSVGGEEAAVLVGWLLENWSGIHVYAN